MDHFRLRNTAIEEFANTVEATGAVPTATVHRVERLVLREVLRGAEPGTSVVCGIATTTPDWHFCQGHWDFMVVDHDFDPAGGVEFHDWVVDRPRSQLAELSVRHYRGYWLGIAKGGYRCEICGYLSGVVEQIINGEEKSVMRHHVCIDHCTYRPRHIDNSRTI